jgi:peroxiredoxin
MMVCLPEKATVPTILLGLLVALSVAGLACAGLDPGGARVVKEFNLKDTRQRLHTPADWKGKKAVVLFFLDTECPVSNRYAPQFTRLASKYSARGCAFYGIHVDPDVTAEEAERHSKDYKLTFVILLDPAHQVVRQTGVKVVPEAVLLSPEGRVLYRGRIDDLYGLDGKRREEPTSHDLEAALDAVLAGKAPPTAETEAFGCPLPRPKP